MPALTHWSSVVSNSAESAPGPPAQWFTPFVCTSVCDSISRLFRLAPECSKNHAMIDSVFPTEFGNSALSDSTWEASVRSAREPTALLDSDPERHERLALPPDARQQLWVVLIALASFWLVVTWTVQSAW